MTDSADMIVAARKRLSDIDTHTLKEMWATDGRTDWAEEALRLELIERGANAHELDMITTRRSEISANAPPSVRGTLWNYGVVGRLLTFGGVILWLLVVHAVHAPSAVVVAGVVAILCIYVYVLTRRTVAHKRQPVAGAASFAMLWQLGEAWLILLVAIIIAGFTFTG
jgi:hypothetical protein